MDRQASKFPWKWPVSPAVTGITVTACTPHILPTVYDNTGPAIKTAVAVLQNELAQAGVPLRLVSGADVNVTADIADGLKDGRVLTLNNSRYLLLEPPHHAPMPQLEDYAFKLQASGVIGSNNAPGTAAMDRGAL